MHEYLIVLPLPENHATNVERFLKAGVAFLETTGQVKRKNLGTFARSTRAGADVLHLVSLSVSQESGSDADLHAARSLETVLRSALAAAKAPNSDLRVFVQRAGGQ
jgi:hypothetical protein